MRKIRTVRLITFVRKALLLMSLYLSNEKLIALPTANKNDGKTRSVGVKPNQVACSSGGYGLAPLPGVLTMIIKQMVIPLKTSNAKKRSLIDFMMKDFVNRNYLSVILELIMDAPSGVKKTSPVFFCKTLPESRYSKSSWYLISFLRSGKPVTSIVSSLKPVMS